MEWHSLLSALRLAETSICEHGVYAGFTLGQVWQDWPDEVVSGRLAGSSKARSGSNRIIKTFTKLAQAGADLHAMVEAPNVSAPVVLQFAGQVPAPSRNSVATVLKGPVDKFHKLPLARLAVAPGDEKPPGPAAPRRAQKPAKREMHSQSTQTSLEGFGGWPPHPRVASSARAAGAAAEAAHHGPRDARAPEVGLRLCSRGR